MLRQFTKYGTTEGECLSLVGTEGDKKPFLGAVILIAALLMLFTGDVFGQKNSDPGLFVGTSYYMGDLNTSRHFYSPSLAVGGIYRYNFNARNCLKFSGTYHKLSADEADFSSVGTRSFASSFVDLALNFEFNWKPYQTAHRKTTASPYVFAGLGYGISLGASPSHLTFPFGAGYKINLGRWLSGGIEMGARRSFSDLVDGVTNPGLESAVAPLGNRDWYVFTGVFVTYKIFKLWDDCPTYEEGLPRKSKR